MKFMISQPWTRQNIVNSYATVHLYTETVDNSVEKPIPRNRSPWLFWLFYRLPEI